MCEGCVSPANPLAAKHVAAINLKKEAFQNICSALNRRQHQQQASNPAVANENEQTGSGDQVQTRLGSGEASLREG